MTQQPLPLEHRKAILQRAIAGYLNSGYRVIAQTDTTAQLLKPKKFSCLIAILSVLLLIGWLFYLLYYWFIEKDKQVYLEVDARGKVHVR